MVEILKNYWENRAFVYLHSGALLLSLAVVAAWLVRFRSIRGAFSPSVVSAKTFAPRSESELSRLIAPLEPFATYFDYCSSAFIFIGLLGTIVGFVSGVPKMSSDSYQFDDILRALSTSAAGIIFALVFNLVTIALDYCLLRPTLSDLRAQFQGDALEVSIREHLTRLEQTLGQTLVTFNSGISEIVTALSGWHETSQKMLSDHSKVAADIAATHQSFLETHKLLLVLPESIRKQLAGVFSDATTSMGTTLTKIKTALESFERLPAKIEAGLDKTFQKRQQAVEEALSRYRESIESQRSSLDDLYAKMKALPLEVSESVSQSNARSIVLMEQSHSAFLSSLKTAVRATVEDQMATLGALAGQMDLNARTLREKWDALLASERKSFEGAVLSALHAAIETVEEQRKKLLSMESTLPESLATTFHELIKESQAATQSLTAATRQENVSLVELKTLVIELTAALREGPDRASSMFVSGPGLSQGRFDGSPRPQAQAFPQTEQLAKPGPFGEPLKEIDSSPLQSTSMGSPAAKGASTASVPTMEREDGFGGIAAKGEIPTKPAIPFVPALSKSQVLHESPSLLHESPSARPEFTDAVDGSRSSWFGWTRRLWRRDRSDSGNRRL